MAKQIEDQDMEDNDDDVCEYCGGLKKLRNPRGDCDHLHWPDNLTDEAKIANGYRAMEVTEIYWIK